MKNCIIVLHFDNYYVSVLCHYNENTDLGHILRTYHDSMMDAESIVAGGDISHFEGPLPRYFRGEFGYSWGQVKPLVHESPKALVEYCIAVDGSLLMCYENGGWEEISLTESPALKTDKV